MTEPLAQFDFVSTIIEWRGPAPFLFAPVPDEHFGEIRYAAREVSYGWGMVPVEVEIDGFGFTTSLFPRGDNYLLPIKVAAQRATGLGLGDKAQVSLNIVAR